jgi:hypothetical protein
VSPERLLGTGDVQPTSNRFAVGITNSPADGVVRGESHEVLAADIVLYLVVKPHARTEKDAIFNRDDIKVGCIPVDFDIIAARCVRDCGARLSICVDLDPRHRPTGPIDNATIDETGVRIGPHGTSGHDYEANRQSFSPHL